MAAFVCASFVARVRWQATTVPLLSKKCRCFLPACNYSTEGEGSNKLTPPGPRHFQLEEADTKLAKKTTMTILNQDKTDSFLTVRKYGPTGFVLSNDIRILGSIAIFPKGVLSWRVLAAEEISADSLTLFSLLYPKPDILVLGLGDPGRRLPNPAYRWLNENHIGVEAVPTDTACATFNFLNVERRLVVAALIPPDSLDDDTTEVIRGLADPPKRRATQYSDYASDVSEGRRLREAEARARAETVTGRDIEAGASRRRLPDSDDRDKSS